MASVSARAKAACSTPSSHVRALCGSQCVAYARAKPRAMGRCMTREVRSVVDYIFFFFVEATFSSTRDARGRLSTHHTRTRMSKYSQKHLRAICASRRRALGIA